MEAASSPSAVCATGNRRRRSIGTGAVRDPGSARPRIGDKATGIGLSRTPPAGRPDSPRRGEIGPVSASPTTEEITRGAANVSRPLVRRCRSSGLIHPGRETHLGRLRSWEACLSNTGSEVVQEPWVRTPVLSGETLQTSETSDCGGIQATFEKPLRHPSTFGSVNQLPTNRR